MAIPSGTYAKDADLTRRFIGYYHHEGVARSGRPLRASDQALESQDEGIHLRRAQRNLHYRFAKDAEDVQRSVEIYRRAGFAGQNRALCGNQAPGAGRNRRRSAALQWILCQPAMVGWTAHQLGDGSEIG